MSEPPSTHPLRGVTVPVIGTPCHMTHYGTLKEDLHRWTAHPDNGVLAVDFTNVHIAAMRWEDAEFARTTNTMDAFIPDSVVLTKAANLTGHTDSEAIYGPTFMARFTRDSPAPCTHYFFGATPAVLEALRLHLLEAQPGLQVIGMHHGYIADDGSEDAPIVEEINRLAPDFIWVGTGTPRQQRWMHRNKHRIRRGVLLAVGFAFDVNSGTKKDAPAWMQRYGLVWLFRLAQEPRRLGMRYLKYNTLFLWEWAQQMLLGKKHAPKI